MKSRSARRNTPFLLLPLKISLASACLALASANFTPRKAVSSAKLRLMTTKTVRRTAMILFTYLSPKPLKTSLADVNVVEPSVCVNPGLSCRAVRGKQLKLQGFCWIRCRSRVGKAVRHGSVRLHMSDAVGPTEEELVVRLIPRQGRGDRSAKQDVAEPDETGVAVVKRYPQHRQLSFRV